MKILGNIRPGLKVARRMVKDKLFPYKVASEVASELSNGGSKTVRTMQNRFGETRTITETVEEISAEEAQRILGENVDLK